MSERSTWFTAPGALSWQQWLVLLGMGALVIAIDVRNHTQMWRMHGSGQTLWSDRELLWEILLYGLIFPLVAGVLLSHMGRTAQERDELSKELALRRELVADMQAAQSWYELAELIVSAPGNIVGAKRAWLLAQRGGDVLEPISHWDRPGSERVPPASALNPGVCEGCTETGSGAGSRISGCPYSDGWRSAGTSTRYCLSLSSDSMGRAILLFDVPVEQAPNVRQLQLLDDLGDEMSLAMANANLHDVTQRQGDVAREERLRIARDLHDTLGQNISYLRLKLEQLSVDGLAISPAKYREELGKMLAVADEASEQVRDTLEELRTVERQDLEENVRLYAAQAEARTGFLVAVHSRGEQKALSSRRMRQLMYITREALNNVEKHAAAENVDIELHWSDSELRLVVRDNGRGFEPEQLDVENRYGMTIMRERSQAINADLTIESARGAGTTVTLWLPLSPGTSRELPQPWNG